MLCSQCNKNNAVVFINKQDDKGNTSLEGLCYECAKKRGINPIDNLMKQANLSEADINNMTKQFESMFNDMSENMNFTDMPEDLMNFSQSSENNDDDEQEISENAGMQFGAIPLGSIFSNMFGMNPNEGIDSSENNSSSTEKKRVKVDKKAKKRKALETLSLIHI